MPVGGKYGHFSIIEIYRSPRVGQKRSRVGRDIIFTIAHSYEKRAPETSNNYLICFSRRHNRDAVGSSNLRESRSHRGLKDRQFSIFLTHELRERLSICF